MQITVLNSTEELKSFPINQSIKLKFEKAVEDSLLESKLSLFRLPSQTGLFNISETYNQNIGYMREKFDIEETTITTEMNNSSFVVVVKPVKPLSPGFEYVLFIDKSLSEEYLSFSKTVSKSSSSITVELSNNINATELEVEIISEPFISSTNNIVKVLVKDLLTTTTKQYTLDLKKNTKLVYNDVIVNFISPVYVLGEKFTILSIGSTELPSNFYLRLKASITESIKPIIPDSEFNSITNQDLLDFFKKQQDNNDTPPITTTIVNNGKIRITLSGDITTSDIDFDSITFTTEEAFNMYTLTQLELYDPTKEYELTYDIEDEKVFTITVKEKVL